MKKIHKNLTTWVLAAILIGALLGLFSPNMAMKMEPLGTYFIDIIKIFIAPIIFLTITLGISGMGSLKQVGRVGGKALLYFEIVTTLALLIGIIVTWVIQPGSGVSVIISKSSEVAKYATSANTFSLWGFIKNSFTIQVLLFSILFGVFLNKYKYSDNIKNKFSYLSKYIFKALHLVMLFAPIGAFGGIAYTVGKYGITSLIPLAKLMLTIYITMALFIFIVLGSLLKHYKISIFKFLNYIKEELLIVLGTSSSESALPSLMEKIRKNGVF